jgi:glyoxylate reductase
MARRKPLVVVTRKLPDPIETRMRELFETRFNATDKPMTQAELVEAVRVADVLVPTVTDRIDAAVLSQSGASLKLIANFGAGVDNIDVNKATARGITVTNTPGVLTEDTADITMALILGTARRLREGIRSIDTDTWPGWSPTWMMGSRVRGKRLGIVGMGRIGQAVAKRALAFGMSIHYHNRNRLPEAIEEALEATWWDSIDQMINKMDVVSVHCPHTPATYHLLSARRLRLMKKDAVLINTARGEIVDEDELTRMLVAGDLAGAGLDVYEGEPVINRKLVRCDHVLLLPHLGSATVEGRVEMGEKVIVNIKAAADGHTPPDRVLPDMI